jgi:hypothetical protein
MQQTFTKSELVEWFKNMDWDQDESEVMTDAIFKLVKSEEIKKELEKGRGKDKVKRKARRFKVGGGGLTAARAKTKGFGGWKLASKLYSPGSESVYTRDTRLPTDKP